MKKTLVLSLGSNLGNRYAYLQQAIFAINHQFDTISEVASYYETPPWGDYNQPKFINTAVVLETTETPDKCLAILQDIEIELGKLKTRKWGPRAIDIDLLFYGSNKIQSDKLVIPHPYIAERAFVLAPLCDLIPNFSHPQHHKTMTELLDLIENNTHTFAL